MPTYTCEICNKKMFFSSKFYHEQTFQHKKNLCIKTTCKDAPEDFKIYLNDPVKRRLKIDVQYNIFKNKYKPYFIVDTPFNFTYKFNALFTEKEYEDSDEDQQKYYDTEMVRVYINKEKKDIYKRKNKPKLSIKV